MKSIWYFVGLLLLIIGGIIILTGLYLLINPPVVKTALASMHPDIWWGGIMFIFGAIMYLKNRKQKV